MIKRMNGATLRAAAELLGVPVDVELPVLEARWRELRTQLHPDKPDGDAAKFDQARKAYDAVRAYALEPKPCADCEGTGKVDAPQRARVEFSAPMKLKCKTCGGSGQR